MGSPLSRERPTFSAVLGTTLNNRLPSTCHALPSPLLRNAPCNRSAMKFCPSKGPQLACKLLVARIVDERTRSSCLDTDEPDKLEEFFSNGLCQLDLAPMLNLVANRVSSAPFFIPLLTPPLKNLKAAISRTRRYLPLVFLQLESTNAHLNGEQFSDSLRRSEIHGSTYRAPFITVTLPQYKHQDDRYSADYCSRFPENINYAHCFSLC